MKKTSVDWLAGNYINFQTATICYSLREYMNRPPGIHPTHPNPSIQTCGTDYTQFFCGGRSCSMMRLNVLSFFNFFTNNSNATICLFSAGIYGPPSGNPSHPSIPNPSVQTCATDCTQICGADHGS